MKTNPYATLIRVDVKTGIRTDEPFPDILTARQYFRSITLLNLSAGLYGFVYVASPEALASLSDEVDIPEDLLK